MKLDKPLSYEDLEIYSLAKQLAVRLHKITIEKLPKFEMFEEGSQVRRSSKSIVSNIVEGFGRRRYKSEFVRFLIFSLASCDETKIHLQMLHETGSLGKDEFSGIFCDYEELGAKLYNFRAAVIKNHRAS